MRDVVDLPGDDDALDLRPERHREGAQNVPAIARDAERGVRIVWLESGVVHVALGVERRARSVDRRALCDQRIYQTWTQRARADTLVQEKRGDADIAAPYRELLCPDRMSFSVARVLIAVDRRRRTSRR